MEIEVTFYLLLISTIKMKPVSARTESLKQCRDTRRLSMVLLRTFYFVVTFKWLPSPLDLLGWTPKAVPRWRLGPAVFRSFDTINALSSQFCFLHLFVFLAKTISETKHALAFGVKLVDAVNHQQERPLSPSVGWATVSRPIRSQAECCCLVTSTTTTLVFAFDHSENSCMLHFFNFMQPTSSFFCTMLPFPDYTATMSKPSLIPSSPRGCLLCSRTLLHVAARVRNRTLI